MTEATIRADRLRVEYLKDPIGIDCLQPEIQWLPTGAGAQTAFRVVERDPAGSDRGGPALGRAGPGGAGAVRAV